MHSWFESSDRASMFKIRRQQSAASLTSVSTDFLDTLSIKEVRSNLLKDYEHSKELYSEKDLEKIVNSNDYIRRYLKRQNGDVPKTTEMMKISLKWRKNEGLSDAQDSSFPREFFMIGACHVYNTDLDGNCVLHFRVKVYRNIKEIKDVMEKFVAFQMFKADELGRNNGEDTGWTLVFDLTSITATQYDLPELVWLIQTLLKYYPSGLKKVIVYNLPWFFKPVVSICMAFVPLEWKRIIFFENAKDIFKHIAMENLPEYIGGTCPQSHREVPPGTRTAVELAQEVYNMSEQDVEKIMKNFEKYFED